MAPFVHESLLGDLVGPWLSVAPGEHGRQRMPQGYIAVDLVDLPPLFDGSRDIFGGMGF